MGASNRHSCGLRGGRRIRPVRPGHRAGRALDRGAEPMAGIGSAAHSGPVSGCPSGTLLPAFLFLSIVISIQGERGVHRPATGVAAGRASGGLSRGAGVDVGHRRDEPDGGERAGTVPFIISPAVVSYIQTTGIAARRVGYCIGGIFIAVAFLPKVSAVLSSIPGSVMAGYLIVLSAYLFIDGARTVMQSEENRQRITVAGVCFWIGAAFQFGLFSLPNVGPVWETLVQERNNDGRGGGNHHDPVSGIHEPAADAVPVEAGHRGAA